MEEEIEVEKLDMSKKPKEEVAVFGFGVLLNHQKKMNEILEKIQKFLFFLEKRQTSMEKVQQEILNELKNSNERRNSE